MKRMTKLALAISALVIGASGITWASAGGGWRHDRMAAQIAKALDAIDATPEQRAVVEAARLDIKAQLKAAHQANKGAGDQLAQLLAGDVLDPTAVQSALDARSEQRKALVAAIMPDIVKIHDALTPAQRQALYAKWTARKAAWQQHHQQQQP